MSNATLAHAPTPTDEQIDRILDATADSFVSSFVRRLCMRRLKRSWSMKRSPFLRSTVWRSRGGSSQPTDQRN
jgi:hypothetical protein